MSQNLYILLGICIMVTPFVLLAWCLDRVTYKAFKEDGSGEIPVTLFKFSD